MAYVAGGGGGGGGSLPGYSTGWNDAYGGRPLVPDPTASARSAIGANIGNLSSLYNLAGGVNQFNEAQLLGMYESAFPGYQGLVKEASGNIAEQLAGNVPSDVVNQIIQSAAERGILTGSPGSPNANTALLRSLGLTSLGLQQTGQENLLNMARATPTAAPFDISKLFITPDEIQQAQLYANIYASAPDPAAAAAAARGAAMGGSGGGYWNKTTTLGPAATPGFSGFLPSPTPRADTGISSVSALPDLIGASITPYGETPAYQAPAPGAYDRWASEYGMPGLGLESWAG